MSVTALEFVNVSCAAPSLSDHSRIGEARQEMADGHRAMDDLIPAAQFELDQSSIKPWTNGGINEEDFARHAASPTASTEQKVDAPERLNSSTTSFTDTGLSKFVAREAAPVPRELEGSRIAPRRDPSSPPGMP
jgi:hypothetical protein